MVLNYIIVAFSMLGAIDRLIGNKLGIGKEFERGLLFFGNIALAMIGMLVIAPYLVELIKPALVNFKDIFHIDPSIIPASLFANDMGGASLATELALDEKIGLYNGLVVSSMLGCTISFTIPTSLGLVKDEKQKPLLIGLLCGIITIPFGCFVGGLVYKVPLGALMANLLPIIIFSGILAIALFLFPNGCVKVFKVFGIFIKMLITIGLALGIFTYLTDIELIKGLDSFENAAAICVKAAVVMTGTFPLIFVLSKLLAKPLRWLGSKMGISGSAVMAIISSLATSYPTFEMMNNMENKGILLNGAFSVSGAFILAAHLAFTMSFAPELLPAVISGKIVAGLLSIFLGMFVYKKLKI